MELWDLYDKDRRVIGEHVRDSEQPIPDGAYHLVVHVWIRNREGKYLISQRAANRPTFPLMYECVGGSVLRGESSLEGALRETKEEVGIDLGPTFGKVVFSRIRESFHDIMDVWLFDYNGPVDLANATTDEVAQTEWKTPTEIRELDEKGLLVPTLEYFFEKVGETHG